MLICELLYGSQKRLLYQSNVVPFGHNTQLSAMNFHIQEIKRQPLQRKRFQTICKLRPFSRSHFCDSKFARNHLELNVCNLFRTTQFISRDLLKRHQQQSFFDWRQLWFLVQFAIKRLQEQMALFYKDVVLQM